jgi:Rieske Fe-S protein
MSELSRRSLLRASGAAAAAVPITALVASSADAAPAASPAEVANFESGPVMFAVHDVGRGEVSILHGEHEVVVRDRDLVHRIVKAAAGAQKNG